MARLGSKDYWDARYTLDPQPFDWLQRYGTCKPYRDLVKRYAKPADQIIVLGAGSSRLSEELHDHDKYKSLYNVDFSAVAISQLNERYAQLNEGRAEDAQLRIESAVMDLRSMDFNDGSFDVALDKAVLDVVLCGEGAAENAAKLLSEVARVLRPNAVLLLLSSSPPESRMTLLQGALATGWTISSLPVPKPTVLGQNAANLPISADIGGGSVHYLYVCARGSRAGK